VGATVNNRKWQRKLLLVFQKPTTITIIFQNKYKRGIFDKKLVILGFRIGGGNIQQQKMATQTTTGMPKANNNNNDISK